MAYHNIWSDPSFENDDEAWRVLDLIVAEFVSDPASVQCFDLRLVERAKECVAKRKQWERAGKLPPLLTAGKLFGAAPACPDCGSKEHFEC